MANQGCQCITVNPTTDSKWDLHFTKSWRFSDFQLMFLSLETVWAIKVLIFYFLRKFRLIAINGSSEIYAPYIQVIPDQAYTSYVNTPRHLSWLLPLGLLAGYGAAVSWIYHIQNTDWYFQSTLCCYTAMPPHGIPEIGPWLRLKSHLHVSQVSCPSVLLLCHWAWSCCSSPVLFYSVPLSVS